MPNEFINIKEIARQALPRLMDNLVFPNLIHKDFSSDFVQGKGAKIQVRKPVVFNANEFDDSQGVTPQNIKETSVEVELDKIATVDVEVTALQGATSFDDINRLFVIPAAAAIAEKINSDGLLLYKDIPSAVGTAGTTPSALSDIANVRKQLNLQKAPTDSRNAVWDPSADSAFTTIPAIVNAEKSGDTKALRDGSIGRVFGLGNYMSQAVKSHTAGTSAGVTGLKVTTAASAGASSVTFGKSSFTGTVKAGDIVIVDGINYVATEDAEADSNAITVKISPALKADVTTNSTVSVVASHIANLAFHPMAFAFVTRPLVTPSGVDSYVTNYNGLSLRVTKGYDMKYKKEMLSMDVLYGYKTMYPELATRVLG